MDSFLIRPSSFLASMPVDHDGGANAPVVNMMDMLRAGACDERRPARSVTPSEDGVISFILRGAPFSGLSKRCFETTYSVSEPLLSEGFEDLQAKFNWEFSWRGTLSVHVVVFLRSLSNFPTTKGASPVLTLEV
jgi:hypothetical protein